MIWKNCVVLLLVLGFMCGSVMAKDRLKNEKAEMKTAINALEKNLGQVAEKNMILGPDMVYLSGSFAFKDIDIDWLAFYEQKGFPLIVFLNPDGKVIKKIGGYRDVAKLAMELNSLEY
ncbi:MAG: hypothetical protein WBN77_03235 [Desulfobacterales bacterium]